ncbi:CaiB/BaiF CoA transferase family protein [Caenimonas aquaedulcis]|uniref:CoA transferase n=1 Tax=Caenimonas aquaedulcis TaxID=2793270 RepID=A0A931H900_9BURK|nr:CoA transferase [Caenimonas aquaedulcis]MBG9390597.1 CoA transferase [Caenimonas aquaedulcis]
MNALPLAGVRIADFTWIGAGSFTTKMFSDFGADVIKIESQQRLDSLRISRPFKDGKQGVNRSGYFSERNSNKRSITLNLKDERGQAIARRLIQRSDIVANNFTPGTMEKFGLGYDAVRAIKPEIIYLAMSMQGATGPERDYLGYGLTIGALTGLQFLSGLPGREPAGTGTNYPDHIPNPCHAAFAVLAALRHLRRTGEGQFIDVAQTEPTVSLLGPSVLDFTVNDRVQVRSGNEREHACPHGVYPCTGDDRWIAISVSSDSQWRALLQVLGSAQELESLAGASLQDRRREAARIDEGIAAVTRGRSAEELMETLQRAGVPASVVRNARDLVEDDAQLRHRQHWVSLDHAEMGRTLYGAPPYRMSDVGQVPTRAAPLLGEHTDEVLGSLLDLAAEEIDTLRTEGVLT